MRENLRPIVQAIGVDAVTNAVLAIGNARLYLEQVRCGTAHAGTGAA